MTAIQVGMLSATALMLALGQFLFKVSAERWNEKLAAGQQGLGALLSVPLVVSLVVYASATLLWVYVLRFVPLSKAYAFVLLGAALVPVLAATLLGETLTLRFMIGFAILLAGVYLCAT